MEQKHRLILKRLLETIVGVVVASTLPEIYRMIIHARLLLRLPRVRPSGSHVFPLGIPLRPRFHTYFLLRATTLILTASYMLS